MKKSTAAAMFALLVVACGALGWGVSRVAQHMGSASHSDDVRVTTPTHTATPKNSVPAPTATATATAPTAPAATPTPTPTPTPSPTPVPTPSPTPTPKPVLQPGPKLLGPGDNGTDVRKLQARLRQIDWFSGDVTDSYGPVTTDAVEGFQRKRGIPVTGYVDQRTLDRLDGMTHEPSKDELANNLSPDGNSPGKLDARCTTGRVICIDKSSRTLRWVVDGNVEKTLDVRFGAEYTPTREGVFQVDSKDADHVSKEYGSAMPYSMFFSRGQAVHYSSDFAARGYAGASHGCVNVRDYDGIKWLFGQVAVGDKVVVYWS